MNIKDESILEARRTIGARLKELREEQNLTQSDFADMVDVDRATIAKIEQGKWNFGIDTLNLFLQKLKSKISIK
jgi:transcriptional regulator with XRE-family HTH domain